MTILLERGFLVEDAFGRVRVRDEGWAADAVVELATQLEDVVSDFLKLRSAMHSRPEEVSAARQEA
ncbi:hypothetical protein CSW59_10170 [Caulobacter sp. BP25]|nr:hypothetical protein CSW59_10170 [Caulobacter sp. BP25]